MTSKELKEKTEKELHDLLGHSRDMIRSLRFKVSAKQLKGVREIRETRKTIARILTILSSKNDTSGGISAGKSTL